MFGEARQGTRGGFEADGGSQILEDIFLSNAQVS